MQSKMEAGKKGRAKATVRSQLSHLLNPCGREAESLSRKESTKVGAKWSVWTKMSFLGYNQAAVT